MIIIVVKLLQRKMIVYCNKRILKECDIKVNREAAEAVTTAYFKRLAK